MIYIKKRLLFVNGHLNIGGIEKSLVDLLNNINYDKYEVDLVLFEELGDYINDIPNSVKVHFFDLKNTYGNLFKCILNNIKHKQWKYIFIRLVFLLEKFFGVKSKVLLKPLFRNLGTYDCAIAYRVGFCTDFVAYVIKSNIKLSWWHHGSYDYDKKGTKRIKKIYNKFNYVVTVSEGCKNMLLKNINIESKKIVVIPNIIDSKSIKLKSLEKIEKKLNGEKSIFLVSIGRLAPEKGMINCVYVCKKLIDKEYNIKWFLIGDGVEYNFINDEINKYNLKESIYLLGSLKNPYKYLKNADIYVHPSYIESMSITVLEAMCLQRPIVVAKSMGPLEYISNMENAIIVEPNVEGLYQGILQLLENKNLCERIRLNNEDIIAKYSPKIIMDEIEKIIR